MTMTTATTTRSAYPVPVDELLPQARQLAEQIGEVPSRNRLMTELRIGAKKAREILTILADETTVEADVEADSEPRGLHLVTTASQEAVPDPRVDAEPEAQPESSALEPAVGESDTDSAPAEVTSTTPDEPGDNTQTSGHANPGPAPCPIGESPRARRMSVWPVLLLALPAFVAIWSGWVGLGGLTGFGVVHPLPGIADEFALNTAITLPIGMEAYAAYALRVWLSGTVPARARRFAQVSALGSLGLGALGQVAYHLMTAAGMTAAPWWITTAVACLPVAVLGMGAALTHLLHDGEEVSA